MGEFGYNTTNTSNDASANNLKGNHASPSEDGYATKITINIASGWASGEKIKCALYIRNGEHDYTYVAQTAERSDGGSGFQDFTFTTPVKIYASNTYAIVWWTDSQWTYYYQTNSDNGVTKTSQTYGATFPSDLVDTTTGYDATCTYVNMYGHGQQTMIISGKPEIETLSVTTITDTTADLRGRISNLNYNQSGNVYFEYGLTDSYGNESSYEWVDDTDTFSIQITGLTPGNTTYHYRAVISTQNFSLASGSNNTFETTKEMNRDLQIYYSSLTGDDFINCWCTRWDQNDYNIVIETFMDKSDVKTLSDNSLPGAVGLLTDILGEQTYYDRTWEGLNTLKLSPNTNSNSTLKNMRSDTIVYVKDINTTPIEANDTYLNVKIEGKISGSGIQ